ncbi:unnamed protein product [Linum tenue]|uniref:NAD(P)H dehydrogenase (quinone) n=1 Tax=Linum tenue TaxID=586396 RepID=A0AAV0Q451_9ROSI|nr:unnamed protein product [Linum tenue]
MAPGPVKVYIIYYSLHGHVETMARQVQLGANSVPGVEATLWQIPETLNNTILQKMKAPPKPDDVPVIQTQQLLEADGFLFGFPSRFGVMAAQCKAFFDATTELGLPSRLLESLPVSSGALASMAEGRSSQHGRRSRN